MPCFGLFFVVVARLTSSHLTMEQPSQIVVCDDYFYVKLANEGSMESPQPHLSIHMVSRLLDDQQRR